MSVIFAGAVEFVRREAPIKRHRDAISQSEIGQLQLAFQELRRVLWPSWTA
ncbi:MAG: hypothetical protein U0930_00890 [Pirellulales bacterium]